MSKLDIQAWKKTALPKLQLTQKEQMLLRYENLNSYQKSERVEAILKGTSKRKSGLTQQDIATLFAFGFDGYATSSGNFFSRDNRLTHYSTIEAIRTLQGVIIKNRDCFSRGFAHCSCPPNPDYYLNLSILSNAIGDLDKIEIVDHVEESQRKRAATLIKENGELYLNAFDDSGVFVSQLTNQNKIFNGQKEIKTVKEAFESMKPQIVKHAEKLGFDVRRQGEFFFIPTNFETKEVQHMQKRTSFEIVRTWFECPKCHIKTDSKYGHPRFRSYNCPPSLTDKQKECCQKDYDKLPEMIEYKRLGLNFTSYPRITLKQQIRDRSTNRITETVDNPTQHAATRLGTITTRRLNGSVNTTMTYTVVQGIIRHPQHRSLKLGQKLHIVVRNNVTRSLSRQGGAD